ncbi:MaoC family dehydratase [Denitratisoma oestradiolicum]|uniref:MaoC like domain-containing protein n=1 Tax=Denitratisoma oestradiolicum TaxID=311182 RepID=A0A6S6XZL4_9PROT|nr:MaoC family dehydratase [Denitratisoma oestradiolicum]TWO78841.1 acyl dehydratase [Denitratisoma oestradiolicum]CAB1368342.1 MaoC like domain-containing protein [Denitratisoma oestradiolicum]
MSWSTVRLFDQVSQGETLPELKIPITVRLIVSTAIATRDFQNVHHDKDAAMGLGSPHIFMNILTSNGLVERYVSEWAGPGAIFKKVAIKLGAPNFPGDIMCLNGSVVKKTTEDERELELKIVGTNSLGSHVTGLVVLQLP